MFQCLFVFSIRLMGLPKKEKNAISLSKGDINEFSKGENNKMYDSDDIFRVQH